MLRKFTLHEPEAIGDVPSLRLRYRDNGALLAGGTELLLVMKEGILRYEHLINIKRIPGLDGITYDESSGQLTIGALATHRALETSEVVREKVPLLVEMERQVGNIRIRNMGTVGGNLCWADPQSDVVTLLLALGARLKLVGLDGERVVGLEEFPVDYYETTLREDEILTEVQVPGVSSRASGAYCRFVRAERPTVGVAVVLTFGSENGGIEDAVITLGCVNPTPVRAREAEDAIRGKAASEVLASLERIGELAAKESSPAADVHASEWYKREVVKVMVQDAVREAYNRKIGQGKGK